MNFKSDLHAGRAGENLVAFDLLSRGFDCFHAEQGMPYDLVADIDGQLLKVQVKTTRKPQTLPCRSSAMAGYVFHVSKRGKMGRKSYTKNEVDIFALVAIDSKEIGYVAVDQMPTTFFLRVTSQRGTYADEVMVVRNKQIYDRVMAGECAASLGQEFGVEKRYVDRLKFGRARTFVSGFYLPDLTLDAALTARASNDNSRIGSSKKSFLDSAAAGST